MVVTEESKIIEKLENGTCRYFFIFQGNNMLVTEGDGLPSNKKASSFIKCCSTKNSPTGIIQDLFCDEEYSYTACHIKSEASFPPEEFKECKTATVREYFFLCSDDVKKRACSRAHGLSCLRLNYHYCPSCGGKLCDDEKFTAKKCTVCNKLLFPRIEPAVIVLVSRGNEILLEQNKAHKNGVWSCVAGFVEIGETAEHAVEREIKEETGIDVKNIKYRGSQSWPFPDQLMLAYTAEYKSGEIKIQEEELNDARWFSRDSLPELPKPGSVAYNLINGKI